MHLVLEALKYLFELAVFAIILVEIRKLRRHEDALKKHSEALAARRPLFTTLVTDEKEILSLAVSFTKDAHEIYALGSIRSLVVPTDGTSRGSEALDKGAEQYIIATRDFIQAGYPYYRIINFLPEDSGSHYKEELIANLNFFIPMLELSASTQPVKLCLCHNSDALKMSGDFHFRCSEHEVIIRVGNRDIPEANAAIVITDQPVVSRFQNYYKAIVSTKQTKKLSFEELKVIRQALIVGDVVALGRLLRDELSATPCA